MNGKYISVYLNSESIEDRSVISLYDFMGSVSTEDDSIRMVDYINQNRNRFPFERLKINVINNGSFSEDMKVKIKESRNIGELLDVLESKLHTYCFSGYYDTQEAKYIHSELYTLKFNVIEQDILRHRLMDDPFILTHFPSFDRNSIIAIVLGKKESTPLDMDEVSSYHRNNFDEISKYCSQYLEFIPSKMYSSYSMGVTQPFLEEKAVNKNVDEFFWRNE